MPIAPFFVNTKRRQLGRYLILSFNFPLGQEIVCLKLFDATFFLGQHLLHARDFVRVSEYFLALTTGKGLDVGQKKAFSTAILAGFGAVEAQVQG